MYEPISWNQINKSGKNIWVTWIGERLDLLEDRGLIIPIMPKVNALREQFYEDFEKSLEE